MSHPCSVRQKMTEVLKIQTVLLLFNSSQPVLPLWTPSKQGSSTFPLTQIPSCLFRGSVASLVKALGQCTPAAGLSPGRRRHP